jgi:hypothetical protein
MNETAGSTAHNPYGTMEEYKSTITNRVKYRDNWVYTNVRRFVVVRHKREFCFACPIFTYGNRATTKPGVKAKEHGVIYSENQTPQLIPGESGITKASIGVVMADGQTQLQVASPFTVQRQSQRNR